MFWFKYSVNWFMSGLCVRMMDSLEVVDMKIVKYLVNESVSGINFFMLFRLN